jgi:hypothetical protein
MTATFFLSTGRCGTQALHSIISQALSEEARVVHEPIGALYKPKLTLGEWEIADRFGPVDRAVQHFQQVCVNVKAGARYIECGWPAFSWFRQYAKALGQKWQYVHLVRNPVHVAASLVTHKFHNSARKDAYSRYAFLNPSDAGARYAEFLEEWQNFSDFEKCLYQWLEINAYGLELAKDGICPRSVVKCESLFANHETLLDLFGTLGWRPPQLGFPHVDRWRFGTSERFTVSAEKLWKEVERVALALGYSSLELRSAFMGLSSYRKR